MSDGKIYVKINTGEQTLGLAKVMYQVSVII